MTNSVKCLTVLAGHYVHHVVQIHVVHADLLGMRIL